MRPVAAITHLTEGDRKAFQEVRAYVSMGANDDGVIPSGGFPSILVSFEYDRGKRFFDEKLQYWPDNCMGDSGAFTVWTKGQVVDLDEYIDWCRYYVERRPDFAAISLDVIPGGPDRAPTARERTKAMRQSLANGDRLRAAGLKIMEVYHWHEPIKHLDALLERRQPGELLGIGGLAGGGSRQAKLAFVQGVFDHVRTPGWKDLVPLHGLGIAPDSELCYRLPWFSVDSSSWSSAARFGRKVTANGGRGGDDYRTKDRTVRHVYVSRVLASWLRYEEALSKVWADRGVTYAP